MRQHASCQPRTQLFGSCLGFAVLKKNLSLLEALEFTPAASATTKGDIYVPTWYVYKFFFFIFRLMRYIDVCFFSLSGVLFSREKTIPQLNETVKHDNIRESDRHDRRYMYIPSFALPIYKTTSHAKPYLCCCCCCCCTTYCWLVLLGVFFFLPTLLRKLHRIVQNPQKSSGYDQGTTMRKNMLVVTPRCAAAAVVSAVVLRRPTKEYTHPYSMMHRRLTTAGIEVAPHHHQLLVWSQNQCVSYYDQ